MCGALQVSIRQRVSDIGYGSDHADLVRCRLTLALNDSRSINRTSLVEDLESRDKITEH